jgi:hypothetical protein
LNWRSTYKHSFAALAFAILLVGAWTGLFVSALDAQSDENGFTGSSLPLEKLVYPLTRLCILDVRGKSASYPFEIQHFIMDLQAYLRSADYLTVKTETEVEEILRRNRVSVPESYDPRSLTRICRITDCDYLAYLRMITFDMDLHDGLTIPVLFHKNKVTYRAELDVAVLDGKTGSLQYSKKVIGEKSVGKGYQLFPITEDPALHLNFREKETLARMTMQDLARRTFETVMTGMQKTLGDKYICYWGDEVHIISDKPGLCPICGSRLVKIKR